ncbi:MAG: adenylate/guanylate cyclase domain-containing protein [Actinomycetota bacterium]
MPEAEAAIAEPIVEIREAGRQPIVVVIAKPLTIGRECDGLLLGSARASRRHAQLTAERDRILIADLGSRNGTFVDDERIDGPTELRTGSVALVGDAVIRRITSLSQIRDGQSRSNPGREAAEVLQSAIQRVASDQADQLPDLSALKPDHGTATIVFTDIESSTELGQRVGDRAWLRVLSEHNAVIEDDVRRHRGLVVGSAGDGFLLVFSSARSAVECTMSLQRRLAAHPAMCLEDRQLRVRMGIHTGEVLVDAGDIHGTHVNTAARIADAAEGGEILVSAVVREIVSSFGDLRFGETRRVDLKGIGPAQSVHPVLWDSAEC